MTWLALAVFVASLLVGLVGVVAPVLPGVPLAALGAVAAAWIRGFDVVGVAPLVWVAVLAVVAQALDFAAGAVGARVYGARRAGFWGGVLGSLAGLIWFPPFGFLLGALIGAVGAELLTGRPFDEAVRAGVGAFAGSVGGIVAKGLILIAMAVVMVPALL
ncbi:MAG: DUF456 domain-containing protein [Trueperaceae bacterium]|nr:DUF456 domain-containing protein [Trueperaceae bacterium]